MNDLNDVHVVVPAGIDDPNRPSGGNIYDRRLIDALPEWGWSVHELPVAGAWPTADQPDLDAFDAALRVLPDDALVLVDGLIASGAESLVKEARRLRIVVLVHMPDATDQVERDVFRAARGVITTSEWSRDRVIERHHLHPDRVWTAIPGTDSAPVAVASPTGGSLLVVGPVTPAKGHDVLVAALSQLVDLHWHCTCVGSLDLDPDFTASLRRSAEQAGIVERLEFVGPLTTAALADVRSRTDLLVSASRREAYGMAMSEALAAGIPVIGTDVGGQREAIGLASSDTVPGMLIAVDAPAELAAGLRRWLTDPSTRDLWRASARLRRTDLGGWSATARGVADVLAEIHREPGTPPTPI